MFVKFILVGEKNNNSSDVFRVKRIGIFQHKNVYKKILKFLISIYRGNHAFIKGCLIRYLQ
ncbi:MAG: hypothetical protein CVU05_00780 [Bacteroidetes bacterium HGW-Bacteroidetes-21]|nr:MAG: hypothetical protein CVU05_00780 [Bacteroidetes bacterium HGW-Bacteroidetes-21]